MPKQIVLVTLALIALALVPALGAAYTPEVLRVSAIPDEDPSELLRIYAPFAEYLGKQLGLKVQFVPVVDYAATVEGLAARKLDLVWYGGFTSVQAVRRTEGKATRLVMRQEDAQFKSVFVARRHGPITRLADLKGKTFAFGSVSSTSGHLMPRFFLLRNGIDPDRDFAQKPAFMNLHSVDLARAFFPRIVGVREGQVWFDLPPERVLPERLETLYAGAPHAVAPLPCYENAAATSRLCRPAPDFQ